jgi:hypothetical protein
MQAPDARYIFFTPSPILATAFTGLTSRHIARYLVLRALSGLSPARGICAVGDAALTRVTEMTRSDFFS